MVTKSRRIASPRQVTELAVLGTLLVLAGCEDRDSSDKQEATSHRATTIHHPSPHHVGGGPDFGTPIERSELARKAARELEVQLGRDAALVRGVRPGSFWRGDGGEVVIRTTLARVGPKADLTATAICDALVDPRETRVEIKLVNVQGRGATPIEPPACDEPRFRDLGLLPKSHPNR